MKNKLRILSLSALVLLLIVSALCMPIVSSSKSNAVKASAVNSFTDLQISKANIMPLSAPPVVGDTSEVSNDPVYTAEGKRVGYIPDTGMVVTEDGEPVTDKENNSVILYDQKEQKFIDSANKTLAIYLDSHLEKNYLVNGGEYLTYIHMNREVVLVGHKPKNRAIYAFREKKKGFFNDILDFVDLTQYRFTSINGRLIPTKDLVHIKKVNLLALITLVNPANPLWVINLISGNFLVPAVEILKKTTLRDLYATMEHATVHPWARLLDIESGLSVSTTDGKDVRIDPHTNQLKDDYGSALYNAKSGLPIIYNPKTYDIIAVGKTSEESQIVENGVLIESMTTWNLLQSGTPFYMGIIATKYYGSFDVPMLLVSNNPKNPEFVLMNGQSAKGITNEHKLTSSLDGQSLGAVINSVLNGIGNVASSVGNAILNVLLEILKILLPIVAVVLFVILLPVIIPAMSSVGSAVNDASKNFHPKPKKKRPKKRK